MLIIALRPISHWRNAPTLLFCAGGLCAVLASRDGTYQDNDTVTLFRLSTDHWRIEEYNQSRIQRRRLGTIGYQGQLR